MDSIFRDRLLKIVTLDNEYAKEVISAANSIVKAKTKKELDDAVESFILAMILYLLWLGRGYADAVRETFQALYGYNIPPLDARGIVVDVIKKHRKELERAARAGEPIIDKIDAISASTAAVVAQTAAVVGSAIIKHSLPQGKPSVSLSKAEEKIVEEAEQQQVVDLRLGLPILKSGRLLFRYVHTRNMEGICSICAPHVGKITKGDGTDGVPVPPLHKYCRCILLPLPPLAVTEEMLKKANPTFYLSKLKGARLKKAIGVVRAELVESGELELDDLFEPGYTRLKTLKELGYTKSGKRINDDSRDKL